MLCSQPPNTQIQPPETSMTSLSLQASNAAPPQTKPHITPTLPPGTLRIVLTGFMGAGKSTVGALLAARLGWTFLDLDAHLETRAGASVPQLFERHGEAHFRRLESSALASVLRHTDVVLALGGGAPETLTNRLLLEQTPGTLTVFLDAPFATLFDRCMLQALNPGTGSPARDADRPNLRDPKAAETRFNTRHLLYRRLARISLDTSSLSLEGTVPALLQSLQTVGELR